MVARHNKKETEMGLDMYAYTAPRKRVKKPVDFKTEHLPKEELHYWRKHPNLHGWMSDLYYAKGGSDPNFNCNPVELTLADLDALEQAILNGNLPSTCGFFFGESDGTEKDDDLLFIKNARQAIAEGLAVYYDSWW